MRSQAYFEDIREKLIQELRVAQFSIVIAVAWFTDKEIFRELLSKAAAGVNVQLIIAWDDINKQRGPDFTLLEKASGAVIRIVTPDPDIIMHNKFCIIDTVTIISGSYNWTKKAAGNHENITITWDAPVLARQFLDEFERIKNKYGIAGSNSAAAFDFSKVNQRLQLIRYHISLNEFEEIKIQSEKIQAYELPDEIKQIIDFLQRSYYSDALVAIDALQTRYKALVSQDNDKVLRLRMELRYLEVEHISLQEYHDGLERTINDFRLRVRLLMGDLIHQVLDLKIRWARLREKFGKSENYQKIKQEYEQFEKQQQEERKNPKIVLSETDEREIRELYRKGAKLCHPDHVDPAHSEQAKEIFIRLKSAFDENNIVEVRRIVEALEAGTWTFGPAPADIKEADKLEAMAQTLRLKIELLRQQIAALATTDDYVELSRYPSIEAYVSDQEIALKKEILYYQEQINAQQI